MITRKEVEALVDEEREYQQKRWPDHKHNVAEYLTYLWHYYRLMEEADTTLDAQDPEHFLVACGTMRKFAALCVACYEDRGMLRADVYALLSPYRTHMLCWSFTDFLARVRVALTIADTRLECPPKEMLCLSLLCLQLTGAPARGIDAA